LATFGGVKCVISLEEVIEQRKPNGTEGGTPFINTLFSLAANVQTAEPGNQE